jgi:hypothetical protein
MLRRGEAAQTPDVASDATMLEASAAMLAAESAINTPIRAHHEPLVLYATHSNCRIVC